MEINELRPVKFTRGFTRYAEGSVLVEFGNTKVLCNASVEDKIPPFLKDSGEGWVTAEYSMLPRATLTRTQRASRRGKPDGRSVEIQRLIGRSLRAVVDRRLLGEYTITIDCDVIQADGGTRTASITGGFVALYDAIEFMLKNGLIVENPIREFLAAVSVGIVEGKPHLDLCYEKDSIAEGDMNIVMTESGKLIEVQGTAEGNPFSRKDLNTLLDIDQDGIFKIISEQKKALGLL